MHRYGTKGHCVKCKTGTHTAHKRETIYVYWIRAWGRYAARNEAYSRGVHHGKGEVAYSEGKMQTQCQSNSAENSHQSLHCYVVNYGQNDCEQIHSRIKNNWCRTFRPHRPLSIFVRSWQRLIWAKHLASVLIDSATYLFTISLPYITCSVSYRTERPPEDQ